MKCAGCEIQLSRPGDGLAREPGLVSHQKVLIDRAPGFCFVAGRYLDGYDRAFSACGDEYLLVVAEGLRGQANRCDAEVLRRENVRSNGKREVESA
jgi:hypothetical protein